MGWNLEKGVRAIAALALVCALTPVSAFAQRGGRRSGGAGRAGAVQKADGPQATDARPQAGGQRQQLNRGAVIAHALRSVGLTRDQQRKIREIRNRNDERMRDFGRRFLDARRDIDAALFAEPPAIDRARSIARELSHESGERLKARTLIELDVFQVLTPEQRAEVRRMRDDARNRTRDAIRDRLSQPATPQADADEPDQDGDVGGDYAEPESEAGPEPRALGKGGRGRKLKPRAGAGNFLARMSLTPEQQRQFRQLRRQHGPRLRELNFRARRLQLAIDDALLSDRVDVETVRRLADEQARAEAEREMERFEIEAGIRQILTPEQAAMMNESRRGPRF